MSMEKRILAPGIVVYRNPVNNINGIFEFISKYDLWAPGLPVPSRDDKPNLENHRDVSAFDFVTREEDYDYDSTNEHGSNYIRSLRTFKEAIDPCFDDYIESYSIDILENKTTMYQAIKYSTGQRFSEHNDDSPEHRRVVSAVYYVNSDYSGGGLYFNQFDILYTPEAGDCLIFPAMWVYSHTAVEISNGIKQALVSFRK